MNEALPDPIVANEAKPPAWHAEKILALDSAAARIYARDGNHREPGMPGENKIELTDAAIKLAVERHLSATLVPGVRVLSVSREQYPSAPWFAIVTTDPPEPETRNGAGAG